ncbi:MAG: hypothetical protein P4L33_14545 [Capsulimonadaceae bacterium]|nr:hypothetical protein [Capsulimonadaceae bacterium]
MKSNRRDPFKPQSSRTSRDRIVGIRYRKKRFLIVCEGEKT